MANRPDPNNPQPGDVFVSPNPPAAGRRSILARLGDYCASDYHNGRRPQIDSVTWIAANWTPAPPMPPDRWGVMYDDGAVITWSAKDMARNAVASERDTFLVHYVGTVVEP